MPQEINNSESTAEKVVEAEIKDAATNIKASEPEPDAESSGDKVNDEVDAPESDLDHWKRMSRKNENDFKKASKERDSIASQLTEANLRIARLTAQREHPQITDEMFDKLCGASTPEAVAEWAESFAGLVSKQDAVNESPHEANESAEPTQLQLIMQGVRANKVGGGKMKGAVESEEDGRAIARKLNEKRIARAHGRVSSGDK